jgi:RsiW-degrading membrane proteinase PrsW (M82 family)
MLYMVISALGFAALENIAVFFAAEHPYAVGAAFIFALLRFAGAVFLHTLTSGTLGFFIALSFCSAKGKKALLFSGFFIAIILHGVYNISVVEFTGFWQYFIPATIVIILAVFTTFGFIKLKKLKSICKISV